MLHAQIKTETFYKVQHSILFKILFEPTVFLLLQFPTYIAVHELAVTNSTKHVTHLTSIPSVTEKRGEEKLSFWTLLMER